VSGAGPATLAGDRPFDEATMRDTGHDEPEPLEEQTWGPAPRRLRLCSGHGRACASSALPTCPLCGN